MNKKDYKYLEDDLTRRMDDFLQAIDVKFPDHPYTPTSIEEKMAQAAFAVLEAGWWAYEEGARDNQ